MQHYGIKSQDPLFSVIIPIYNTAPYLKRCLNSVCNQTYTNLEIICVNDGSTDNSADIINEYAMRDSRIIVITQENKGLSDARNAALDIAKGEWITGVDSDDYIETDMFEYISEHIRNSDIKLVITGHNIIKNNKIASEKLPKALEIKQITPDLLINCECYFWAKLWHRDCINTHNVRFPSNLIFEDAYFYYTVTPYLKEVLFLPRVMYHYMRNAGQCSISDLANSSHESNLPLMDIIEKILNHYTEHALPTHMSQLKTKVVQKYYGRLCSHLTVNNHGPIWKRLQKLVQDHHILDDAHSHPYIVLQYFLNPCIVSACQKLYAHSHQFATIRGSIHNFELSLSDISNSIEKLQNNLCELRQDSITAHEYYLNYNKSIQELREQVLFLHNTLEQNQNLIHELELSAKTQSVEIQQLCQSQEKLIYLQQQLQVKYKNIENNQQLQQVSQERNQHNVSDLYRLFVYEKQLTSLRLYVAILKFKKFFTWGKHKQRYKNKLEKINIQILDYKTLKNKLSRHLTKS